MKSFGLFSKDIVFQTNEEEKSRKKPDEADSFGKWSLKLCVCV